MTLNYIDNPELSSEKVAALRVAVGWEPREKQLQQMAGCTYLTTVCMDGEQLVGYVDVISDGVDDAFIRNLLVHPRYRRQGIGLRLLERVRERARTDGIKTINVLFEPQLTDLYLKAGFRVICGGIIDNEAERY